MNSMQEQAGRSSGPVDLDEVQRLIDDAIDESGPWAVFVDGISVWVEALGDGSDPGDAAARLIKDSRDREARMVAELRAARVESNQRNAAGLELQYRVRNLQNALDLRDAELRAAREVVTALKQNRYQEGDYCVDLKPCGCSSPICVALRAYDKAAGGGS
jgi:hypothetical protein